MLYCPAETVPLHSGMTMLSICTAYNTIQCYAKLYYNITYNSIALCCMVYSYWHHTIAKQFVHVSNSISSTETLHIWRMVHQWVSHSQYPRHVLRHANTQHLCVWDMRYLTQYMTFTIHIIWHTIPDIFMHIEVHTCYEHVVLRLTLYSTSICLCIYVYLFICAPPSDMMLYNVIQCHILYLLWCIMSHM